MGLGHSGEAVLIGIDNVKAGHAFRFGEIPVTVGVEQVESGEQRAVELGRHDKAVLVNVEHFEGGVVLGRCDEAIMVGIENVQIRYIFLTGEPPGCGSCPAGRG